jgi:pyroglutamyl-peptidase
MRILVYGFGPYRQFQTNITQRIVRKLPSSRNLKKIVFPVRFDKEQFTDAVKKYRPDFVLGLGQCPGGRLLRIERHAINRRRNDRGGKGKAIVRGGPKTLATTLRMEKLPFGRQMKISRSAGDYVCNFSMYVMLDYLRRYRPEARFGFIHIPYDYDLKRATRVVAMTLKSLAAR